MAEGLEWSDHARDRARQQASTGATKRYTELGTSAVRLRGRKVQWFRGGLVSKVRTLLFYSILFQSEKEEEEAHRLWEHSSPGLKAIVKKK